MQRIKTNDKILVISGKNKGSLGVVQKLLGNRVIIEGVNFVKKHVRRSQNKEKPNGIIEVESSIHVSNVSLFNSETNKPEKIGFKILELKNKEKKKVRFFKSSGRVIDV